MEKLSKKEILYNELKDFPRSMLSDKEIYKAMETYAKQTAIALIGFIEDGNYKPANNGGYWKATKNGTTIDYCSSEELYEIFKQHVTNQSK